MTRGEGDQNRDGRSCGYEDRREEEETDVEESTKNVQGKGDGKGVEGLPILAPVGGEEVSKKEG